MCLGSSLVDSQSRVWCRPCSGHSRRAGLTPGLGPSVCHRFSHKKTKQTDELRLRTSNMKTLSQEAASGEGVGS